MNNAVPLSSQYAPAARVVNWSQVSLFVGLTFAITWLLNLGLYQAGGLASPVTSYALVLQMLIPAFAAILLGTFVFSDSSLYFKANLSPVRWFTYFYMAATILLSAGMIVILLAPALVQTLSIGLTILVLLGPLVALIVRWRGGKDTFAGVGMAGGRLRWWLILGLGFVAFYIVQTLLNVLFGLGKPGKIIAASLPSLTNIGFVILNALVIGPLANILAFFGEEYGWRGFLLTALTRMGRVKGVFLVGVVWGIWHAPLILMGYNYPEQPVLGVLLMILFCVLVGYFFAYAVYKSKGVWTAAFLHGVNNNVMPYLFGGVFAPTSVILSFGAGVYGLACMAVVVALLLRDPVWRTTD